MPTHPPPFEASQCDEAAGASAMDECDSLKLSVPASATVEGLRNVAGPVQLLLQQDAGGRQAGESNAPGRQAATAWSVLFASVLQKPTGWLKGAS